MRWRTMLASLAIIIAMMASGAIAQTAAGYAIQTGQSIGTGTQFPAIQPPSISGDNNPRTFSIPSTATDSAHRSRHEKAVDNTDQDDKADSSANDNWVEVK